LLNNFVLPSLGNFSLVPPALAAAGDRNAKNIQACSITSKWSRPDLADPGNTLAAMALDEIQASIFQGSPVARIPVGDPMVLDVDGNVDISKTNAYRRGVNQFAIARARDASTTNYCIHMYQAAPRIFADSVFTKQAPSPTPDAANLFAFLAQRFTAAVGILGCQALIGIPSPFTMLTAPASREHLAKYSHDELARYGLSGSPVTVLTTIATDATFSQTSVDQANDVPIQYDDQAYTTGESVTPSAPLIPESYFIPLVVVSTVLGTIITAGTTAAIVLKVKERKKKKLSSRDLNASAQGSGYVTDITNGYPIQNRKVTAPTSPTSKPVTPSKV